MRNILKIIFVFAFTFILFWFPSKVYAADYGPDVISDAQLQSALNAFKDYVSTYKPIQSQISGKILHYTAIYNGAGIVVYCNTLTATIDYQFGSCYIHPNESSGFSMELDIQSDGTFTLPTGWGTNYIFSGGSFITNHSIRYTDYSICTYSGTFMRGPVNVGEKYQPTQADMSGPVPSYDSTVPTPSNLRVKYILPKGLFPKIRETQLQSTWTPTSGALRAEISLVYDFKSGTDTITKVIPYVTYADGVFASAGQRTDLLQTDIEKFIHDKNSNTSGQTFENGKLNLVAYYIRFSIFSDDKLKYGNWVKVDLVTGGSFDDGNVTNKYDEVYTDKNGDEISVDNPEYGGTTYDNDGKKVDPTSLRSFTDYLLAIPNILAKTFEALVSLIGGIGKFNIIMTYLFVGMSPVIPTLLVGGIGLLVILGIIKFLK